MHALEWICAPVDTYFESTPEHVVPNPTRWTVEEL